MTMANGGVERVELRDNRLDSTSLSENASFLASFAYSVHLVSLFACFGT